jgi:lipopolysaccharide biosynthesis glycosyltransferase
MTPALRVIVVTGADEAFAKPLRRLVGALWSARGEIGYDLACVDLGLSECRIADLSPMLSQRVEPRWDLDVGHSLRHSQPHLRALTARPFLRDYFPGYDVYIWLDADIHIQRTIVIDWLVDAARHSGMAIVPQVHHAYRHTESSARWRAERLHAYFGEESARRLPWQPYYNAGVFAITADAPHWTAWADAFRIGLSATQGMLVCDQTALNEAIHTHSLPVTALPAICNWLCHLGLPVRHPRTQEFMEPGPAGRPIALVHMSAGAKEHSSFAEYW